MTSEPAGGKSRGERAGAGGVRPGEQQAGERSPAPAAAVPVQGAEPPRGARWAPAAPAPSAHPVRPVPARPVRWRPQPGGAARSR